MVWVPSHSHNSHHVYVMVLRPLARDGLRVLTKTFKTLNKCVLWQLCFSTIKNYIVSLEIKVQIFFSSFPFRFKNSFFLYRTFSLELQNFWIYGDPFLSYLYNWLYTNFLFNHLILSNAFFPCSCIFCGLIIFKYFANGYFEIK